MLLLVPLHICGNWAQRDYLNFFMTEQVSGKELQEIKNPHSSPLPYTGTDELTEFGWREESNGLSPFRLL